MKVKHGLGQTAEQTVEAIRHLVQNPRGQLIAISDHKAGGVKAAGDCTALDLAMELDPNWRTYHVSIPFNDPTAGSHALGEHLFQQAHYDAPRLVIVETGDPVDYVVPFRLVMGTIKQRSDIAFIVQLTPTRMQLQFLVPLLDGLVEIPGGPGPSAITRRIPELLGNLRSGEPVEVLSCQESVGDEKPLLEQIPRPAWPELIDSGHAEYNGHYAELKVRVVKRTVEGHLILNLLEGHINRYVEQFHPELLGRDEIGLVVSYKPKNLDGLTGLVQLVRRPTGVLVIAPSEFTYHTSGGRTLTMYELREAKSSRSSEKSHPEWIYVALR